MGMELFGEHSQIVFGQSKGFAQVLDDALDRVGGHGPGEDGELGAEVPVHPLDEFVSQGSWEVEVYVGEGGHVLGDEAFQGEAPAQGVDVADADEVADQQGHR